MNLDIALLLAQDGLTNGAIYALLGLAIVMVFAVTRIIFVPQGEFVSYGALTLASFQLGQIPATLWLMTSAGIACAVVDIIVALRDGKLRAIPRTLGVNVVFPCLVGLLTWWWLPRHPDLWEQVLLTLLIVVPFGPMLYRLAFQPLQNASVLVLLIVAVAVHFALVGLGLYFFGAEGSRTPSFSDLRIELGFMTMTAQSLFVMGTSALLIAALGLFFERTITGKALRATAINRVGARLVGISPGLAGKLTFTLAAAMGVVSGVLIAPLATIYYDTGFIIGLKGFVAAIIGGLVSYPLAAAGAILVGLLEAFSSFWYSAYKDVIVFTLIIPVLLWRSLRAEHIADEDDEE
jgi:branched-chain amino acid transport system permease protein